MEIKEKFLPIGTVCLLKDGKKKVMITGYCTIPKEDRKKVYDYTGCLFPEGTISLDKTFLFNHDQIDKIFYMGYKNEESEKFNNALKNLVTKINNGEIDVDNLN